MTFSRIFIALTLFLLIFLPNLFGKDFPWDYLNNRVELGSIIDSERTSNDECPIFNIFGMTSQVCKWNDNKEISIVYGGNENLYTPDQAHVIVDNLTEKLSRHILLMPILGLERMHLQLEQIGGPLFLI